MSYTLLQLKNQVRDLTGYDETDGLITDDFLTRQINLALDRVSQKEVFEATGYIQLIEDQILYTLPATFIDFLMDTPIGIYDSSEEKLYPLEICTEQEWQGLMNASITVTNPSSYGVIIATRRQNLIELKNFTPGSSHTDNYIRFQFYRYHEQLEDDTDTPFRIPLNYQMMLAEFASSKVKIRDNEYEQANYHTANFERELERLKRNVTSKKPKPRKVIRRSGVRTGYFGRLK